MIELGFWDTLITVPFLLIGLSPAWFAFTKSTRVRWMLAIGWWVFGFLLVSGNLHRMGDPSPPIVLIGYPIGMVIGVSSGQVFIKLSGGSVFGYGGFFAKESEPKNAKSIRKIKGVVGMRLKIVELTSLNIDRVYPDSERTFPHPVPTDIHDRRRAWIIEMLNKGFRHFSAFNEADEKVALVEYMTIEESLDNIVGENVNSIHCLWDKTDPENGKPTQVLLDVVESESFKVGRGVAIVAWRMKDLLIKQNYKIIGGQEGYFLALKASAPDQHVSFITDRRTPQVELVKGKVTVDVFWNVWCSYCAHGLTQLEWVRQACNAAAQEVGERIILREHLINRTNIVNYGIGEQHIVLINGERWSGHGYDKDDDPKPFIQRIRELTSEVYED